MITEGQEAEEEPAPNFRQQQRYRDEQDDDKKSIQQSAVIGYRVRMSQVQEQIHNDPTASLCVGQCGTIPAETCSVPL